MKITLERFVEVTNLAMHALGYMDKNPVEIFFTKSKDGVKYSISQFGIVSESVKTGEMQYEGVEDFFEFLTYFKRYERSSQGDDLPLVCRRLLAIALRGKNQRVDDQNRVSEFLHEGRFWE